MTRAFLLLSLLAALLLRAVFAPGVMPAWQDGRVAVVLCGISGGSVLLDLGDSASPHESESSAEHCVFAASVALGFASVPGLSAWRSTAHPPARYLPALGPRGPPLRLRARGPPVRL